MGLRARLVGTYKVARPRRHRHMNTGSGNLAATRRHQAHHRLSTRECSLRVTRARIMLYLETDA